MFIADAYSKLWQRHASNALLYGTGSLGGRLEIGECIKVERTEREVYYVAGTTKVSQRPRAETREGERAPTMEPTRRRPLRPVHAGPPQAPRRLHA